MQYNSVHKTVTLFNYVMQTVKLYIYLVQHMYLCLSENKNLKLETWYVLSVPYSVQVRRQFGFFYRTDNFATVYHRITKISIR